MPFFQLILGYRVVKKTPMSSTEPSMTAISAVSHFSVSFLRMQMTTWAQLSFLLGSSFCAFAYSAWSGSLGGAYMTGVKTRISCCGYILEYSNRVFSSIYLIFQCLLEKQASLWGLDQIIRACESIIYLSSFFRNSFLFHFDEPKLNFRPLEVSKSDEGGGSVYVVMCLDSLVRVRDDLIINMSIKIKCKPDMIDSSSLLYYHPIVPLFLNNFRKQMKLHSSPFPPSSKPSTSKHYPIQSIKKQAHHPSIYFCLTKRLYRFKCHSFQCHVIDYIWEAPQNVGPVRVCQKRVGKDGEHLHLIGQFRRSLLLLTTSNQCHQPRNGHAAGRNHRPHYPLHAQQEENT